MNNNISERNIEIDNQEYTLFLNRTAIVNWEKMTKLQSKAEHYNELQGELEKSEDVEITDETNPLTMYGENTQNIDKEMDEMIDVYVKFYWVALYTHHKLSLSNVKELFDKAIGEYGLEQLVELANQMLEDAQQDIFKKRKNLSALKPTKKN